MTDLRAPSTASTSIRFSDFVLPLWQRWRGIILFVGVSALVAVAAALLWPKSYRATATLLPPERRMDNPLFVPGSVEGLGAGLRGITLRHVATPTDVFVAILRSRTVLDSLVERH
ncbi:MAG TPA: Wzz/FepE/Etk N-terminal domain-containing protein, partial [bacterium]|nr:Wzz/FepE/Etk N-terminal domain-containing protein [bacterium]